MKDLDPDRAMDARPDDYVDDDDDADAKFEDDYVPYQLQPPSDDGLRFDTDVTLMGSSSSGPQERLLLDFVQGAGPSNGAARFDTPDRPDDCTMTLILRGKSWRGPGVNARNRLAILWYELDAAASRNTSRS
jgi:hypothetical protein